MASHEFHPLPSFDLTSTPRFVVVPLLNPSSPRSISDLQSLLKGYTMRSRLDTAVSVDGDIEGNEYNGHEGDDGKDSAVVLVPYNQVS